MPIVQFTPFSSLVQPSFWHELTKLKLDVLRLSDESVPIHGSYSTGRSVRDRETGAEIALGCNLSVGSESFSTDHPGNAVLAKGTLKNFNTIEEFKDSNKTALFNQELDKMWESIIQNRDTSLLAHFFVITYSDLKKYKYYYWFTFPAFVAKPAWEIGEQGWRPATVKFSAASLTSIHSNLRSQPSQAFFIVKSNGDSVHVLPLDQFSPDDDEQTIAFIDPSASPTSPGWPLRNVLAYLKALYPFKTSQVPVLCWRDADLPPQGGQWKSTFGVVSSAESTEALTQRPSGVGWEKNNQGKLSPRIADLAPMMDPARCVASPLSIIHLLHLPPATTTATSTSLHLLPSTSLHLLPSTFLHLLPSTFLRPPSTILAEQAVDLNLKLMRWRILPALNLEKVSQTRCLLLGAGTLGCYVARTLMGWGVRTITFVDSAKVSFSNPVRQPLFEFEDCINGGKPKAACAAERLKKIYPGINASGHDLSVPMPGHPIPPLSVDKAKEDVKKLEKLFDEHDVVFLLMDSRESRWLPTVMGAAKGKIVLNAALGFDTFLVMRHGSRATEGKNKLGCYYCNDIVAPTDSLTDRTLDQMCTVTRPGLAAIASATAVEMLVSLLQHPEGINAPAPPPQTNASSGLDSHDENAPGTSVLGLVPHQLRGFLAQFRNIHILGAAYDRCTGCSETVVKAYETQGFDMLLRAFNDTAYLEKLTGLDKLYEETKAAMESGDWDVEEGEDGDDF
ncbi:hypothetical protein BDV98DRAFT_592331 [Pterulicium gracile]|uniref:Ubiquitin-like modifier-activating enzyme ATG7 n=1 Tax=Pterulicium gracile TaxID=1884261 RepID=A0A5C3QWE5_9AGAR|nr:hypothetical protein BDV98DRAFT_592331 [Pterula gracilis]